MKFILLLKCVHFAVCKLYFNKVLLKKWTVFDKEARVGNRRCLMLLLYIYIYMLLLIHVVLIFKKI